MHRYLLTVSGALLGALLTAGSVLAGDGSVLGTGIGAVVGGVFGSQFGHGTSQVVNTGIGVGVGGLIGNSIGQDIDTQSHSGRGGVYYTPSYSDAAPITYTTSYAPNYVAPPAPPPTYLDQAGTYCREYSQNIRIDGRLQESYGTACLQPDGTWRIVQ